ncbi:MAG TPA: Clp protease N-terminal domain-containing protein [Phycisphaerae bacterium]|nr:Clp protease N-terminal domain-containing protein [Phycisphaerae bacterium]
MFEKLTPRMEHIIQLSQQIARDFDQEYVGTEHLLLAIIQEGTSLAAKILADKDIDLSRTRAAVERLVKNTMEDTWVFGRLPGTPHFRNVMSAAIEEARQLESKFVNAEHMLIALAREDGSVAGAALAEFGLNAPLIRSEVNARLDSGQYHPHPDERQQA